MPRQVGTTDRSRIPLSAPRLSPAEPLGGVVEDRSSLSQGASEPPARGKSNILGETLPQPVATIPPMDVPHKLEAVEERATKASAPREELQEAPPAALPLPKNDTGSQGGAQPAPPQELKNSKKRSQKSPTPKNSLEKEPGSGEISLRASGKDREKATSSGTARSTHNAPAQPSPKEGTQGSGGWYIKK